MESLNMNNLASSLPSSSVAIAEKELMDKFKAAAMSITTLYRTSLSTSKRHYNAGYAAALQDLLVVIQQGVSVGGAGAEGEGMNVGRVMDWIDARLEAIKSREEEEDEEERENKMKSAATKTTGATAGRDKDSKADTTPQPANSLPTPRSPDMQTSTSRPTLAPPVSPSPPPAPARTTARSGKSRSQKESSHPQTQPHPQPQDSFSLSNINFNFGPTTEPTLRARADVSRLTDVPILPLSPIIGVKRRHAVTLESAPFGCAPMPDSPFSSPLVAQMGAIPNGALMQNGGGASAPRRRTKGNRGSGSQSARTENLAPSQGAEAMDVEDEGRERKRVARR